MAVKKHLSFSAIRKAMSAHIINQTDGRASNQQIRLHDVIMSGFACMFYQDPSLLAFQRRLEESQSRSNLQTQFGVKRIPKTTQMRAILDGLPRETLLPLFKHIMTQVQRAKWLEGFKTPWGGYLCSLDGTQYYASTKVHCQYCLRSDKKTGRLYTHKMVQAVLTHPDQSVVFPFMPVHISNQTPSPQGRQDSERRASERLIVEMKQTHPRLKLTLLGDALYSEAPFVDRVKALGYHFIFTVKPDRQRYLFEEMSLLTTRSHKLVVSEGQYRHRYTWYHDLPLTQKKTWRVNCVQYCLERRQTAHAYQTVYSNTWVTDHAVTKETVSDIVRSGRCRWKIENECFNNLKNQGYCLEHNFGHGEHNLSFNFVSLMVLAFFCHQVLAFGDRLFQSARKKHGSKRSLWESLRAFIRLIVFDTFEALLAFSLSPTRYTIVGQAP